MPSSNITLAEIKEAHHKAAQLVMIDRAYLPLFDRLEREIADHKKARSLFDRAKAIANG
ncbi:MAG: hypothetical protein ACI9TZ_003176 [Yoonia sp.]|jgi:hypothetical protein